MPVEDIRPLTLGHLIIDEVFKSMLSKSMVPALDSEGAGDASEDRG